MARERIGVVTEVIGRAVATGEGGGPRVLAPGEVVYADDLIETGAGAYVAIRFLDGAVFDLAGDARAVLDAQIYDPAAAEAAQTPPADSIEEIQAFLRAGGDPTALEAGIEPTAAGPAAGEPDEQDGHTIVVRPQDYVQVTPEAGLLTAADPLLYSPVVYDELPVASEEAEVGATGELFTVPEAQAVNLVVIFDRSSSMARLVDELGQTQLEVAKAAVADLLQTYAQTGATVNVLVVDFAAAAATSGWVTMEQALERIEGFEVSRDTNYRAAISLAQSAFGTPPSDGQTVVWFFSDGEPWPAEGTPPVVEHGRVPYDLPPEEIAAWEAFLSAHDAEAFAVGMRATWDDAHIGNLADVALPDGNVILVTRPGQLADIVVDHVEHRVEGNVLANDTALGAVLIESITVDGVIYSYDAAHDRILVNGDASAPIAGSTLEITTDLGGFLTFHFADGDEHSAGDFAYVAPAVEEDALEQFEYVIEDAGGDRSAATLTIEVLDTASTASAASTTLDSESSELLVDDAAQSLQFDPVRVAETSGLMAGPAAASGDVLHPADLLSGLDAELPFGNPLATFLPAPDGTSGTALASFRHAALDLQSLLGGAPHAGHHDVA